MLMPGVELGECAIASAGSVVMKSIPEYEVHGGNPAGFLRRRAIKSGKTEKP
jgi:acetyltransferase-like isoleucine patch superfamily enzyme